jgi:threonylcarbamoyladenosine tRNA methylthiotransferase MtaB
MAINSHATLDDADLIVPNPDKLSSFAHFRTAFPGLLPSEPGARPASDAFGGRSRATVKIQDGCSIRCSYCSIPYTRPGMVSRPAADILSEVGHLAELGYREVILTGVLIGAYGPATGSGGPDFESLVERIAQVPGIQRVRISSIEMGQVSDRLIDLIRQRKVVPHLHIPLQSGDTQVLRDMNRPYSQEDYLRLCHKLYAEIPDLTLTTDIMVGFPTETDERFESTLHVVREARFFRVHGFRFSLRPGTPAHQWGDPIPDQVKQERVTRLNQESGATGAAHAKKFVGRVMPALVESRPGREGLWTGLTENYLEVQFAGPATVARSIVDLEIQSSNGIRTFGEMVTHHEGTSPKQVRLRLATN